VRSLRKAVLHLQTNDPVLAAIIQRIGVLKPGYRDPTFESLTRAIVYQQLNGKAARTIYERFEVAAGGKITPESVLSLTEEQMRKAGLSRQKLSYIRDLAGKTLKGEVDFEQLLRLKDNEVIEHLTRVKGIGVWSAQMFLMFALRRPNVLPTGDYGIRAAIQKAYKKRSLPNADQMIKLARKWEPYRTLACYYLWRSLDIRPPEPDSK
jgi:DNA-3-methyladenine glycosylase II